MATRDDHRDVVCLGRPTEFLYACLNSDQEFICRQVPISLQELGEANFAILFPLGIWYLGYSVCANYQEVPWVQLFLLDRAFPIAKQPHHSRCARQAAYGSIGA